MHFFGNLQKACCFIDAMCQWAHCSCADPAILTWLQAGQSASAIEVWNCFCKSFMEVFKVFKVCFPVLLLLFCSTNMSQQLRVEQRSVIKYLCAQGTTPIQCWRRLQEVYGASALGKTRVRAWHKQFWEGDLQTTTKNKACPGRPRSGRCRLHIEKVQQ